MRKQKLRKLSKKNYLDGPAKPNKPNRPKPDRPVKPTKPNKPDKPDRPAKKARKNKSDPNFLVHRNGEPISRKKRKNRKSKLKIGG